MNAIEQFYYEMTEPARRMMDALAIGSVLSGLLGLLPVILTTLSTALACAWMGIRIYETTTVQAWLMRRRR